MKLRNQKGNILVIWMLLLPVLLGFLGVALDFGYVLIQKQKIQNAIDLAVLGAAQKTPISHGEVVSTAVLIANENGVIANGLTITHPYQGDNLKVEIVATKKVPLFFLSVLGIKEQTITTRSVAGLTYKTVVGTSSEALDYVLFNGNINNRLEIQGNSMTVNGHTHSNDDIRITGNNHVFNGNVTAVDGIDAHNATITGIEDAYTSIVPMPILDFEAYEAVATNIINGNISLQNIDIEGVWVINGDLTINGGRVFGSGVLIVEGNVKIGGNGLEYDSEDSILAIYGRDGIDILATDSFIKGVLYAPTSRVTIHGSGNTVEGAILADEIVWGGSEITVSANYDIRVPQSLTIQEEVITLLE